MDDKEGYNDKNSIKRRINKMQEWINNPILLEADNNAKYKEIADINLDDIKEPIYVHQMIQMMLYC